MLGVHAAENRRVRTVGYPTEPPARTTHTRPRSHRQSLWLLEKASGGTLRRTVRSASGRNAGSVRNTDPTPFHIGGTRTQSQQNRYLPTGRSFKSIRDSNGQTDAPILHSLYLAFFIGFWPRRHKDTKIDKGLISLFFISGEQAFSKSVVGWHGVTETLLRRKQSVINSLHVRSANIAVPIRQLPRSLLHRLIPYLALDGDYLRTIADYVALMEVA